MTTDELLDEAWALYVALDDQQPMWEADLDQIERWFSSSVEHTEDARRRCDELRGRLEEHADRASSTDAVSLLTAAAGLRALAGTLDVGVELTMPSAEQGLLGLLHWAVNGYSLTTEEHGERYHEKLRRFPAAMDELCERLADAAAQGRAPLRRHAQDAVVKIDAMLDSDIAEDPLLQQAPPTSLDEAGAERFRSGVAELVATHTRPALVALRVTLGDTLAPAGRDDDRPGLVHRPGGEQEYAMALAAYTRPGLSADELHDEGRRQLARLDEEWSALGRDEFGVDDPAEVRRRTQALPGRASADEVRRDALTIHARAEQEAPAWFARVPEAACDVRTVEHGGLAFYTAPAKDGSRGGIAYFNVADPTVWGAHLAATVVHEGIPGHHYQVALAQEDADLHDIHRDLFLSSFGEGWALYVERVGDEMGLYPDRVARLGMLSSDALRATRLVVDTGLHALGWSRQRAIDVMVDRTGLGVSECTSEVDRYIVMPGQATSYMTGRLWIERLRDHATDRLGDRFDIRTFHDVVLSRGMVSLDALDVLVEGWIDGEA